MPLYKYIENEEIKIVFWKIEEPESFFLEEAHLKNDLKLSEFKHPLSRIHWLAGRKLLFEILGKELYTQLDKDKNGKPFLKNDKLNISLSHSGIYVAVALSCFQVGIDIQEFNNKLPKLASKFIPEEMLSQIVNKPAYAEKCHLHWGVKEAIFKAYGKGALDFKKHIILDWNSSFKDKGASFKAYLNNNEVKYEYQADCCTVFENYFLCFVTKIDKEYFI